MAEEYIFKGKVIDIFLRFYLPEVGGVDIALLDKKGILVNSHRLLINTSLQNPNIAVTEFKKILKTMEHGVMDLGKFTKLITLDRVFLIWETQIIKFNPCTFEQYCEHLKSVGWKII